jgi:hypothetical protein
MGGFEGSFAVEFLEGLVGGTVGDDDCVFHGVWSLPVLVF